MNKEFHSMSDEDLARQTQLGSLAAFEELVFRYERRIYTFVHGSCHNFEDAREITQDTFIKAYQAISQYDDHRRFASWLFAIARRKSIDNHRARASRKAIDDPPPQIMDENDPSALLSRTEEHRGIWTQARCQLPEGQFQALWLKYVEGMTVAEIARVLRKTEVHIKVLLFRARQILARHLQRDGQVIMPLARANSIRDGAAEGSRQKVHVSLPIAKGII